MGGTTDEKKPYFWARLQQYQFHRLHKIEPFVQFVRKADGNPVDDVNVIKDRHFVKIREEINSIVTGYPNVYGSEAQSSESA